MPVLRLSELENLSETEYDLAYRRATAASIETDKEAFKQMLPPPPPPQAAQPAQPEPQPAPAPAPAPAAPDLPPPTAELPELPPPTTEQPTPGPQEAPGVLESSLNGVLDAGREILKFVSPSENVDNWLDTILATTPKEEDSGLGGFVRGATQYGAATAIGAPLVALAGLPSLPSMLVGGALVSGVAFDPREENLTNMLPADSKHPAIMAARELLATDPSDPEYVNRARKAGEDVAVTLATAGLGKAAKYFGKRWGIFTHGKAGLEGSIENTVGVLKKDGHLPAPVADDVLAKTKSLQATRDALEDVETAIEAASDPDMLAQLRQVAPASAARVEQLLGQNGDLQKLFKARKAAQHHAEAEFVDALSNIDPHSAWTIGKHAEQYLPDSRHARLLAEGTATKVRALVGDAAADPKLGRGGRLKKLGYVKSRILPGTFMPKGAEAGIAAIRNATHRRAEDLRTIGKLLDPDEWWRGGKGIQERLTELGRFLSKAKRKEKLIGLKKGDDPIAVTALHYGGDPLMAAQKLDKIMPGVAPIDKVVALRVAEEATIHRMTLLSRIADPTDEDLAHFLRLSRVGQNIREVFLGEGNIEHGFDAFDLVKARGEGGREPTKLAKALAESRNNFQLIHEAGGKEEVTKLMRAWGNGAHLMTPEARTAFGRQTRGGVKLAGDSLYELFVNNLLSAPLTHLRNAAGNAWFAVYHPLEEHLIPALGGDANAWHDLASSYKFMLDGFEGALNLAAAYRHSAASLRATGHLDLKGAWGTMKEGTAFKAFRTMQLQTGPAQARQFEIDDTRMAVAEAGKRLAAAVGFRGTTAARLMDAVGTVVNLPARALVASDELAKSVNWYSHVGVRARQIARSKGLTGTSAETYVADLRMASKMWPHLTTIEKKVLSKRFAVSEKGLVSWLRDIDNEAQEMARKLTFSDALVAGQPSHYFQNAVRHNPYLRFVAPFIRVPAKILERASERTPLAFVPGTLANTTYKRALAEGGAAAAAAKNRVLLGSLFMAYGGQMALEGRLFGRGPNNADEAKTFFQMTGAQPSTIMVNDPTGGGKPQYVPLDMAGPHGKILHSMATLTDVFANQDPAENEEMAVKVVEGFADVLLEMGPYDQFLQVFSVLKDPARGGAAVLQRYITGFLPGARITEHGGDPRTLVEAHAEIHPKLARYADWLYQTVNAAYDERVPGTQVVNILGETVVRPQGHGIMGMWAGSTNPDVPEDDFTREIRRLSILGRGIRLRADDMYSYFGSGPAAIQLTPEQRQDLIAIASGGQQFGGVTFRQFVNKLVNQDSYKNDRSDSPGVSPNGRPLGKGGKVEWLEAQIRNRVDVAKILLAKKYPELMKTKAYREAAASISDYEKAKPKILELLTK